MTGRSPSFGRTALIALAFAFCDAKPSNAQAALLGPGAAYIGEGISQLQTKNLDDRLAANGYPTFGRDAVTLGLGAYRILSTKVMLGFEGTGIIIGEEPHQGGEVGLGGGYATLGLGYMTQLSSRVRAYPRIGIGAGGFGLWIENADDSIPFDDVLANPRPVENDETILSRDGFVTDIGAGIEFLPRQRRGPMIGLRFGYLVAPFSSAWDLFEDRKATGGPDASISGPYIRVVIGGAWRR
jgi:hypothetical protein